MLRHKSCQPVPDFSTPKASTLWSQVTVELRVDGDQDLSQCGTIKIKKKNMSCYSPPKIQDGCDFTAGLMFLQSCIIWVSGAVKP